MKIKVTFEKVFDAVEYTMSEDWENCTYEQFFEYLVTNFTKYPYEIIEQMIFEEIKENDNK